VNLEHEPAGEIELVQVDGKDAKPGRYDPESAPDLLSDQLEVFGRDQVFEEAVRSFAPAAS
jgi:hypothetical protein